jgi:uncharacterized hydrophobic protein (TIGR00271 family)
MPTDQSRDKVPKTAEDLKEHIGGIWAFFVGLINLKPGLDRRGTIQNIKNNKKMEGANAWLLMASIVIASIGLDQDSQAVIIGAMLISPLMAPILGVGLAIGINDKSTLFVSLQHFGIAIVIALVTSTLYFLTTPFGEATEQILLRTKPTALDVGVAFFGGLAGIISGSRKDKSNAIPGVAIATALMPPLCVTGFGIANGNLPIILNSFYLFFLNSVFVALATYLVVRLLRFPMKEYINKKEKKKTSWIIAIICVLIIIPSVIIGYGVFREVRQKRNINAFMSEYIGEKAKFVDSYNVYQGDSVNLLIIKMYGTLVDSSEFLTFEEGLKKHKLGNFKIEIIPTSEINPNKIKELEAKLTSVENVESKFEEIKRGSQEKEKESNDLKMQLDSIIGDTFPFITLSTEAKILFPDLRKVSIAKAQSTDFQLDINIPIVLVQWPPNKYQSAMARDEKKLTNWMQMRAGLDTLELVRMR